VPPLIYLNGVSKTVADGGSAGVDGAPTNTTNVVRFGLKDGNADDYLGYEALATIYKNVVRTQEQITNRFNLEKSLFGVS